jgi:hypothetical protein
MLPQIDVGETTDLVFRRLPGVFLAKVRQPAIDRAAATARGGPDSVYFGRRASAPGEKMERRLPEAKRELERPTFNTPQVECDGQVTRFCCSHAPLWDDSPGPGIDCGVHDVRFLLTGFDDEVWSKVAQRAEGLRLPGAY